jgi:hypothetical protein
MRHFRNNRKTSTIYIFTFSIQRFSITEQIQDILLPYLDFARRHKVLEQEGT